LFEEKSDKSHFTYNSFCSEARVVSRAGLFESGRVRPKCFGPISGLRTKLHNIQSNDFFLSWRHLLYSLRLPLWLKWVIFLPLVTLANTAAFFCSLLDLVSCCLRRRQRWGNQHAMVQLRKDHLLTQFSAYF